MSDWHFVHCRECGELFRPSPHDRTPEFRLTPDGYTESTRDDCVDFLVRHARHQLQTLRPTGGVTLHEGPLSDPLAATCWQVTDGTHMLVVRGWRETVTEPLRYRLEPGRLVADPLDVEIPEQEIRQKIDGALYPGVVPERKLAALVAEFKTLIWDLEPACLEILYDVPADPMLSVAKLPAFALERLVLAARRLFGETDAARIEMLLTNADDSDALSVLVRQRVRIEV